MSLRSRLRVSRVRPGNGLELIGVAGVSELLAVGRLAADLDMLALPAAE
jgi:hypothetical protein